VSKGKVPKLGEALSDEELWLAFSGGDDSAYTLLYFRYADRNWRATRPQLARWYESIARRPSFEKTVPKA